MVIAEVENSSVFVRFRWLRISLMSDTGLKKPAEEIQFKLPSQMQNICWMSSYFHPKSV